MFHILLPSTSKLQPISTQFRFGSKKSDVAKYIERQMKDPFSMLARTHSYRARSAFKFIEMDDKMKFLKPNKVVLDIGCAPGSWCQVAVERCKLWPREEGNTGYLIGVDLQHLLPVPGADIMCESDITSPEVHRKIKEKLGGRSVDVIISDMAPNPIGDNQMDSYRLIQLLRTVFSLFHPPSPSSPPSISLSPSGIFLCKLFAGSEQALFISELSARFSSVRILKPSASRDSSSELYLYCSKAKRLKIKDSETVKSTE